jgi:hypothetical protein
MLTARRSFAGIVILGLVIALAVLQPWRGDAPAEDLADGALPPVDDRGTIQQAAPGAAAATNPTPSPASTTGGEASGTCALILDDAAAFAETERNSANPPVAEPSEDQFRAELENLSRNLAGSTDSELFLTAYLLDQMLDSWSNNPRDYALLFELGLRASDSDSSFLAWHALRACVDAKEYCPFPHLEQGLLEVDRDNAEAWALVATLRYRRGDVAGALAAMQGAARASTSTWYWTETSAMIERALAAQTSLPYIYGGGAAFGYATTAMPNEASSPMCRAESETSRAWAEACLAFGTLRAEHNETDMARAIAHGIRERALTSLGDPESAAAAAEEYALYSAERIAGGLELSMSRNLLRNVLASTDPERFYAYLGAVREFGEMQGNRMFLRQELPPLLERAGLLERDGARECVAQFFDTPTAVGTLSATFRDYPVEEYPLRVGDQLQLFVRGAGGLTTSLRVGPDGAIALPNVRSSARLGVPVIDAVGKTTRQLRSEISAILSQRYPDSPSFEVFVTLVTARTPEALRNEFDDALREAGSR